MRSTTAAPGTVAWLRPLTITDAEFRRIRDLVHAETGIALNDSKRQMVCSRLGKRLRFWGYTSFGDYWQHLCGADPQGEERERLINAITTNKTAFFREPHHFAWLRSTILPELVARGGPRRLRIWSAGCSTGQEAYSLAATVLAGLPRAAEWNVRILASDIDTDVLATASAGAYPVEETEGVPADMYARLFESRRSGPGVRVREDVRALVTFRRINLHAEPWPIRTTFDCIFCRNVVIYFDKSFQVTLVRRLADFLRPGGHLFLGHSESLLGVRVGLRYAANTVYRKPEATDVGTGAQP